MSDQSTYFTPTVGSELFSKVRDRVEAGLGKARLKTVVRYTSGPQTLTGAADLVTCAGTFTVNLPAAPLDGDHYEFVQENGGGATLTIGRNGKTINGAASDATIASQWAGLALTWSAAANTWWSR